MAPGVRPQVVLPVEPFAALAADLGFLARVYHEVLIQGLLTRGTFKNISQ